MKFLPASLFVGGTLFNKIDITPVRFPLVSIIARFCDANVEPGRCASDVDLNVKELLNSSHHGGRNNRMSARFTFNYIFMKITEMSKKNERK